jgi:hypothetical protein
MTDLAVLSRLDELRATIAGPDQVAAMEALGEYNTLLRDNPDVRQKRSRAREMIRDRKAAEREAERRAEYEAYIQSDEWRRRRAVAIRKAGERCQVCNRGGRLEVHHRTYERFGAEMEDDLVVLCGDCHGLYENAKRLRRLA